ncbi:hypothetical protein WI697_08525 [Tistrella mobilis]|uniref:DUF6925 family protein n=1 Tax=Tistrella mobilis TaxID=171437 RepID=UPI0031F67BB6
MPHASISAYEDAAGPLIGRLLADPAQAWSTGSFGAIAEFMRDADEPLSVDAAEDPERRRLATDRGAIAITLRSDVRPLAYETPSSDGVGWSSAIAFCLPEAAAAGPTRTVVTELGPDADAVRPEDRNGILFDLGLGIPHTEACLRASTPEALSVLRGLAGRLLLGEDPGPRRAAAATGAHRVFMTRLARIEVFQAVPKTGETSPEGPHTHLLPKLLAAGRAASANTPIPDGLVAGLTLHACNPLRDALGRPRAFDPIAHQAFQELMTAHGDPRVLALRQRFLAALQDGMAPDALVDDGDQDARHLRATLRVALRQARQTQAARAAVLDAWSDAIDPAARGRTPDTVCG